MKKLMQTLMLNCEQATFLITKEMSGNITFSEKIKMQFHLMACKYCRLFKKQSRFLNDSVEHLHRHSNENLPDSKLDDARKEAMEQTLNAELNKSKEEG